jgi:hypothetical protein
MGANKTFHACSQVCICRRLHPKTQFVPLLGNLNCGEKPILRCAVGRSQPDIRLVTANAVDPPSLSLLLLNDRRLHAARSEIFPPGWQTLRCKLPLRWPKIGRGILAILAKTRGFFRKFKFQGHAQRRSKTHPRRTASTDGSAPCWRI